MSSPSQSECKSIQASALDLKNLRKLRTSHSSVKSYPSTVTTSFPPSEVQGHVHIPNVMDQKLGSLFRTPQVVLPIRISYQHIRHVPHRPEHVHICFTRPAPFARERACLTRVIIQSTNVVH